MRKNTPKPFVFILMPFDKKFNDIYKVGIQPVCEKVGAYAERVDEQVYESTILDRIYNQISKADLVVADLTGSNPNVFYETGYAHALGKNVLILTQSIEDMPFDLKHYPNLEYDRYNIDQLKKDLETKLKVAMTNSSTQSFFPENFLQIYVNGKMIEDSDLLDYPAYRLIRDESIILKIDLQNPAEKLIQQASFQIAILTSGYFNNSTGKTIGKDERQLNVVKISESQFIHIFDENIIINPGAWASVNLTLHPLKHARWEGIETLTIRTFSSKGPNDHNFSIKLIHSSKET